MGATKDYARQILAADIANQRGIPIEAAEDLLDHIQELLYDYRGGMGLYASEESILTEYGIPHTLLWVFD